MYTTSAFPSYKHSPEGETAANGFTHLATDILLISRPTEGRRLSGLNATLIIINIQPLAAASML